MSEGALVLRLKNNLPVELTDLSHSFSAFAKEYADYAEFTFDGDYRNETKLYIHRIRAGSIVAELIPFAPALLPILSETNTVIGFAKHLKSIIDWLRQPIKKVEPTASTTTLENVSAILEPVAKDAASQINISTKIENYAPITINVNSRDANAIQNNVNRILDEPKESEVRKHEKVLMYWYQARNDVSQFGDRAVIESISPRPVKAVFVSDVAKIQMIRASENPFRLAFIVDVSVETIGGKPALYRILDVHDHVSRE